MTSSRILFIDDDPRVLAAFQRTLRGKFSVSVAPGGGEALALMDAEGPYAVLVADMQMPGMNGVEFLRRAQEKSPDSIRLMLTGNADQGTAAEAVNQGRVFSFLTKPCPTEKLEQALQNAVRQYRLVRAEKELLEQTLNGSVKLLTDILSIGDPRAFGHAQLLRDEIRIVAEWFHAPHAWELELGAMLSRIGDVTIPPDVLARQRSGSPLTGAERDMITRAPDHGAALLRNIPRLQGVAEIVRYQRKNFDGSGFPSDSVAGEEIPIGARILRVLSDLLESETRHGSRFRAFEELRETSGRYDPKVLEAVAACFDIYLDARPADAQAQCVAFPDLMVGHLLAEDVKTKDDTLLVTTGTVISPPLLQKLRNFAEISGIREPLRVKTPAPPH